MSKPYVTVPSAAKVCIRIAHNDIEKYLQLLPVEQYIFIHLCEETSTHGQSDGYVLFPRPNDTHWILAYTHSGAYFDIKIQVAPATPTLKRYVNRYGKLVPVVSAVGALFGGIGKFIFWLLH